MIVVSHATGLIDVLQSMPGCHAIALSKPFGDTEVHCGFEAPRWEWPAR